MPDNIRLIIEKAKELSDLIKGHQATLNYNDLQMKMNADQKAQELYARLVMMGREINFRLARGDMEDNSQSSEYELLNKELEQNPLVKEYIRCQRAYLDLLKQVTDRIKNPQ
jgi:cell fate (sporulation/competence/biofilm development) regulator YlbF (YheA/YmcA/DUF963 family)